MLSWVTHLSSTSTNHPRSSSSHRKKKFKNELPLKLNNTQSLYIIKGVLIIFSSNHNKWLRNQLRDLSWQSQLFQVKILHPRLKRKTLQFRNFFYVLYLLRCWMINGFSLNWNKLSWNLLQMFFHMILHNAQGVRQLNNWIINLFSCIDEA